MIIFVTLILVRHGFSTINMIHHVVDLPVSTNHFETGVVDPPLCSVGVRVSKRNGAALESVLCTDLDAVCSSNLRRAIQTAHYMTRGRHVVQVLPFLKETGPRDDKGQSHPWNRAMDFTAQAEAMKREGIRTDYTYCHRNHLWDAESGLFRFFDWLAQNWTTLHFVPQNKMSVTLFVVTHGTLLVDLTHMGTDNNGAYQGTLALDLDKLSYTIAVPFVLCHVPNMVNSSAFPRDFESYVPGDKRCADISAALK